VTPRETKDSSGDGLEGVQRGDVGRRLTVPQRPATGIDASRFAESVKRFRLVLASNLDDHRKGREEARRTES
jgi:hypothetical protein